MRTVVALAVISMLVITAYGWRVVPPTSRFTVRWGLFGSPGSLSKRAGLLTWLALEGFVLGASSVADDATLRGTGVGLFSYLLVLHFFAVRRLRPRSGQ